MRWWSAAVWLSLAAGCAPLRPLASIVVEPAATPAPPDAVASAVALDDRGCPGSDEVAAAAAIRTPDAQVRALLIEGCRQSPTLRRLARDIGVTDGVVYVTLGACPIRALRGCLLHTIQDTGNARYLWIRLQNVGVDPADMVAVLAHELQHALEVLERPDVRSPRDLIDSYRSHDSRAFSDSALGSPYRMYETSAAIDAGRAVLAELADAARAGSADPPE